MHLYVPIPYHYKEEFKDYIDMDCEVRGGVILLSLGNEKYPLTFLEGLDKKFLGNCGIIWEGGKWELKLIAKLASFYALSRKYERASLLEVAKKECSLPILFLGMQNLDELRRLKPWALCTRVPFHAAIYGIDLTKRERRPKGVKSYDLQRKYPSHVINLAKKNLQAVKEAGG